MEPLKIVLFIIICLIGAYVALFARRTLKFYGAHVEKIGWKILCLAIWGISIFACQNIVGIGSLIVLHIAFLSLFIDVVAGIIKLVCRKKESCKVNSVMGKVQGCGLVPLLVTAVLLTYGYENMNHIVKTEYQVDTDKNVGKYTIALITDTHYGTVQDTQVMKDKIDDISSQNPDLVVLGGDIVDENTSKEAMKEAFRVLGSIKSKYGIYYVYGNHDRQPYSQNRTFTKEELAQAITENGIQILEDSYKEVAPDLILAGRADAAWGNRNQRAGTEEILKGVDRSKFIIVADHQPVNAQENDAAGVDLQLSGHTHAGQIWPIGTFIEWTGSLSYGKYQEGKCQVIVSSGFTGWGYSVRTQKHCEYALIRCQGKKEKA